MIEINGLYKTYNYKKSSAFEALHNISLHIDKGSLNAIIGRSGSGKSTLLHILGCIDSFEKGSYKFNGSEISKLNEKKRALYRSDNVGIVLQDFSLIETYSVIENVMLPFYFSAKKTDDIRKKSLSALEAVGLSELANKSVNKLSGGQKQRVAIARAIVNSPQLLLADEPTGALDSATSKEIMKLFHMLHNSGITIVIVTHDLEIAQQCERIIEISDGKII